MRPTRLFASFVTVIAPLMVLAQGSVLSEHIQLNIRVSVGTADAAALVSVVGATGTGRMGAAKLKVDEVVFGELTPGELEVPVAGIDRADLEPTTRLLVFFRRASGAGPSAKWTHTGRYELVSEGKIRDVAAEAYVAEVRAQGVKALEDRAKSAKPRAL